MKELIKIEKRDEKETVSARDLHEFLEVKTRFNDWITQRIGKYGFVDNDDYIAITEKKVTAQGNKSEYKAFYLSIDMAKELSMVENNDKGREARRYFIACEKKLKNTPMLPTDFATALRLAADQAEKIAALTPKAELADKAIRDESKQYSIRDAGKHLKLSQKEIFGILRDKGLLTTKNLPTQKAINYNVLSLKTNVVNGKNREQAVLTMDNINEFNQRYLYKGVAK